MSEASHFIIQEKEKLEADIEDAIRRFKERTGFHPARVDVPIVESRTADGVTSYHLCQVKIEIKI